MATAIPSPGRPYAGITTINASIDGLANYVALHNPNLLTANRQQLAERSKNISQSATEKNRLQVAGKIIEVRSSKNRVSGSRKTGVNVVNGAQTVVSVRVQERQRQSSFGGFTAANPAGRKRRC